MDTFKFGLLSMIAQLTLKQESKSQTDPSKEKKSRSPDLQNVVSTSQTPKTNNKGDVGPFKDCSPI